MKLSHLAIVVVVAVTVAIALGVANSLRGDGAIETESRAVGEYTKLEAAGGFEILWTSGAPQLSITTDKNLLPHIHSEMVGETLRISTDQSLRPTGKIKIKTASEAVSDLDLSGAIQLSAQEISGPALNLRSAGAVSVELGGQIANLTADLSGASQLKAPSLSAKIASVTMAGAGAADVAVSDRLNVSISGAGTVTYSGNPAVEKSISGAGSVHRR
jgi:hypothetical protein